MKTSIPCLLIFEFEGRAWGLVGHGGPLCQGHPADSQLRRFLRHGQRSDALDTQIHEGPGHGIVWRRPFPEKIRTVHRCWRLLVFAGIN